MYFAISIALQSLRPDTGTEIQRMSPAGDTMVEVSIHCKAILMRSLL